VFTSFKTFAELFKSNMNFLFLFFTLSAYLSFVSSEWTYEGPFGVEHWKDFYEHCGGSKQSPVDIKPKDAISKSFGSFDKKAFTTPESMTLKNTGHSIKVSVKGGYTLKENVANLPGAFKAVQFHFHWGNTTGSEHTVDGKQYFGEMHIVHYNSKYKDISEAINYQDGLAVLGVFIDKVQDNSTSYMEPIFKALSLVSQLNTDVEAQVEKFSISDLLPEDLSQYYRYSGSLTTPTCNETVTWTVFKKTVQISSFKADLLRNKVSKTFTSNFRPTQPMNGRKLYQNVSSSSKFQSNFLVIFACLILILF